MPRGKHPQNRVPSTKESRQSRVTSHSRQKDQDFDSSIDEDVDFDEDSSEVDALWVEMAKEAEQGGYIGVDESKKLMEKYLRY